jgi:magnesium-transporting ATPase (P-type)
LPLMVLGIWDVDVPQSASNRLPRSDGELESGTRDNERRWFERIVPLLYKNEQKFSVINVFLWCTMGVVHSLIVFYSVWYGWSSSVMSSQGQLASLWLISLLAYSVEICIVSAMTLWVASTWTHLLLWTTLLFNIGAYFAFVFVYNNIDRHGNGEYVSYIAPLAMGNWQFWLLLALVVSMAVLPLVIGNRLVNLIPPLHFKERVMRIIRK